VCALTLCNLNPQKPCSPWPSIGLKATHEQEHAIELGIAVPVDDDYTAGNDYDDDNDDAPKGLATERATCNYRSNCLRETYAF